MTISRTGAAVAGAVAGGLAVAVLGRLTADRPRWERTNFRGSRVSLSGGPAVATGALVGAVGALSPAALACGSSAALLGAYDDLYGDTHARGLTGHARALAQGRVTTGMVKLAGLAATAGAASALPERRSPARVLADAALIAGTANLVNLLDLRPGRALKVVMTVGVLASSGRGPAGAVGAACVGAAAAVLPADLGERVMIGDCGANGLGALLGWAFANGLPDVARRATLVAVIALTLASERVSFTSVIESTPWLRAVDEWGRAA